MLMLITYAMANCMGDVSQKRHTTSTVDLMMKDLTALCASEGCSFYLISSEEPSCTLR